MNLQLKQPQITHIDQGKGWSLEVTGQPKWVKKMIKKYSPEIQKLAERLQPHGNSDQS